MSDQSAKNIPEPSIIWSDQGLLLVPFDALLVLATMAGRDADHGRVLPDLAPKQIEPCNRCGAGRLYEHPPLAAGGILAFRVYSSVTATTVPPDSLKALKPSSRKRGSRS